MRHAVSAMFLLSLCSVSSAVDWVVTVKGATGGAVLANGTITLKTVTQPTVWIGGTDGGRWTLVSDSPNSGLGTLTFSRNGVPLATYQSKTANIGTSAFDLPLVSSTPGTNMPVTITVSP